MVWPLKSLLLAILRLADEIKCSREQRKEEFCWFQSHHGLATKQDLEGMEQRMAIKLSELKTEVAAIRSQVQKIWGEQQTRYDALVVKYDALVATLANQELDAEAQTEVDAFKAELKTFDDTIPDTTA